MGRNLGIGWVLVCATLGACIMAFGPAPKAWACVPGESVEILCSNEQQFVNALAAQGITPTAKGARALVNMGWAVCGDLSNGRSFDVEWNRIYASNPGLNPSQSQAFVNAATANLCPYATDPDTYHPPGYQNWNIP